MVWSLALRPDDAKQDPVVYGTKFGVVVFLAEGPRTASIHPSIHPYIHTYIIIIHTYIHTQIHTIIVIIAVPDVLGCLSLAVIIWMMSIVPVCTVLTPASFRCSRLVGPGKNFVAI